MKKILLDEKEIGLDGMDFPILIHGSDGSGASLYTISLAAAAHAEGENLLFLCGFPMAEKEFDTQVGASHPRAHFFTKEHLEEFKARLESTEQNVLFVKNAELFDEDLINSVVRHQRAVISGDIERCAAKALLLAAQFPTRILFSKLGTEDVPELQKYQAFYTGSGRNGLTSLA
ncbi:MAG: hypothetical protein WC866_01440 [Patescibacteria group bacterium]|jgi:hypothetical protein